MNGWTGGGVVLLIIAHYFCRRFIVTQDVGLGA